MVPLLLRQNIPIWIQDGNFSHLWSLAVEEQFYLFWPLVFTKNLKQPSVLKRYLLFSLCISLIIRIVSEEYKILKELHLITNSDFLIVGCYLGIVYNGESERLKYATFQRILFWIALYIIWFILRYKIPFLNSFLITAAAIIIGFLINTYIRYRSGLDYRLLNNKYVVFVGASSFSIYLWQQIFLSPSVSSRSELVRTLFPYNIIISMVTGIISYLSLEKFLLYLKNKFSSI
ncbi:acyltransferase family protein [Chryseosolibacter indicus]|uniref:Acyltransferase family protein n=1 Tax=Chryseosolibacter indicus TaxID=2782351 RepID=A0ABS5VVJ0_9BACT|nr:acyltransferase family protein [Chryseosolibacter indicus]